MGGTFVDTGVFVAFVNTRDRDHARAEDLVDRGRRGEFGPLATSDYVFDEAVTVALARTRRADIAVKVGGAILGLPEEGVSPFSRLVRVDEGAFNRAWGTFRSEKYPGLSFTDHTILAQVKELALDSVMSFDTHFDGVVSRIH